MVVGWPFCCRNELSWAFELYFLAEHYPLSQEPYQGRFLLFFFALSSWIISYSSIRFIGSHTLIGNTASTLYTSIKGVSSVAPFIVVLRDERTPGRFSTHRPFRLSHVFFKEVRICLLAASSYPLDCGWLTAVKWASTLYSSKKSVSFGVSNCHPLSKMMYLGRP